ncbi:class I SAM-dependent methyltransferase [bacterium]|nr:MAG: class I SAM-dependent methyltransferase [bacterium]
MKEKLRVADPQPCWCGCDTWSVEFRVSKFGLLRCPRCGTFRIDPRPLKESAASSDFYSHYYEEAQHGEVKGAGSTGLRTSRFWKTVRQFQPLLRPGMDALDVGCGNGTLCNELKLHGWRHVIGIDVSRSRIALARQRYPGIQFFDTPVEETGLRDQTQDLIVMDNVIEHLPEPLDFVRALRSLVRPHGTLVITTPNMESGQFRLLGRRWTPELAPHAHIHLFTLAGLRRLLEVADFQVVAQGSFHTTIPTIRDLWRSLSKGPKEVLFWMTMQAAALFARLTGSGEQIFIVARPSAGGDGSPASAGAVSTPGAIHVQQR